MRKLFAYLLLATGIVTASSGIASAEHVNRYYRRNGTYVNSYERSDPNSTVTDNYSFKGNTNPYTNAIGTNYYREDPSIPYFGTSSSRRYRR